MNDVNKPSFAPETSENPAAVFAFLKELWEEMLRVPLVNPDDNFFTIGGDSVLVIEMLVAVSAHFDREFEYNKFFPRPTIGVLNALIIEELKASHAQSHR